MKMRFPVLIVCFALFCSSAQAAVINRIKVIESSNKVKLVIELDSAPKFLFSRQNAKATIIINGASLRMGVQKRFATKNLDSITVEQKGQTCEVRADYRYLTSANIKLLKKPYRIVADFSKLSRMLIPKTQSPEIQKIYTSSSPNKFKIVVALTSFMPYRIITSESGLVIEIPGMNSVIKSQKLVTKDKLIPKVAVDQVGTSTLITVSETYPAFYQIYKVDSPTSLVIEFDKASKSTLALKEIFQGLRYVKMIKGTEDGPSTVNVIIVDQASHEVFPYIAEKRDEEPSIWGAIGGLFTFWMPKEETKYYKDKVSNMAWDAGAVAGVNGTYFGNQGEPLGVLMVNGELVSYSINDRTALIIAKDNQCYIDNVALIGEASIEDTALPISGINTKRRTGDVILFTPRFGSQTDEDDPGTVLSIIGGEVKSMSRVRGWIPRDGYALSIDPSYYEKLDGVVKTGSRVNLSIKLMPLSSIPNLEIKHVIGGGPRLLKAGQLYITKNSEKFKNDIANSRASRTAVGITKEGLLAFVTVDKCKQSPTSQKSVGVTLEELAQLMKEIGCVDAMNLDGGGSSTMVLNSEVMNTPSNGHEVPVSNAILIKQ